MPTGVDELVEAEPQHAAIDLDLLNRRHVAAAPDPRTVFARRPQGPTGHAPTDLFPVGRFERLERVPADRFQ
ncbi:hypothetical protein GCM10010121_097270 [Streptomyces brasiliensis]|uniref:Uncharacterized protein n=2 Tax=Streptomyces brasiliensis TaxID=1954 RepID=A0A917PCU6_9ACTN|nr:hypothetical protein GCM10010121_097270 [Streptomyces brasiliensis]